MHGGDLGLRQISRKVASLLDILRSWRFPLEVMTFKNP
jgi:hypothetical protein